ncbi:hypothetical protein LPW11_06895 [Geomonas sp. RF6]|uniref:LamG-like jellyroll fold domain-containing protein n=1 Tax=Geomonas sp. RF6 TaxID=2897342 RepID=UPI001E33B852|nr:LamG-like jellyroll fold domain-containing protein [Geomonas sp. RF6]UFS71912.1 hypothetical protein LPW11_06895 [Geomonas sp. RF6]
MLADTPEAYWRLGESAGTVAADSSGNGHDATYSGPLLGQAGAIVGDADTAVYFGSSGIIQTGSTGLLPSLDSWTVETWVKVPATGTLMEMVSWYPGGYFWGHGSAYILGISEQGVPTYTLQDVSGNLIILKGPAAINDSSWHHVVGVLDRQGGAVKVYVDGKEVASAPVAALGLIAENGTSLNIGHQYRYWTEASHFQGMMDEVALYRGALSAEQVGNHYDTGRGLSFDSDGDGVPDGLDKCAATPAGSIVDTKGCITQCPSQTSSTAIDTAVQEALAAQSALLAEKDALIAQKDATIASLNADNNLLTAAVASKEDTVAALQREVATLQAAIADKDAALAALNASIAALRASLAEREQAISQLQQQVSALDGTIAALTSSSDAKDQAIARLNSQMSLMFTAAQLDKAVLDAKAVAQQELMAVLVGNLRKVFGDAGFSLPGGTAIEQITSFTDALGKMPAGQIKKLHELTGR